MIVFFLDVDGVLNNFDAVRAASAKGTCIGALDDKCVERFARLARSYTHTIVLSSSWRHSPRSVAILQERLGKFGLRVDSKTDTLGPMRGDEIKRWLDVCGLQDPQFVIFDDDSDMLPEQLPFFVQTSMKTGLTDEHVSQAIEILQIFVDSIGD